MVSKTHITLFGIPNCDTVKKARTWLDLHSISFVFHNFKKDGLTQDVVEGWLRNVELSALINRKGTSWRALNDQQKLQADHKEGAIALVLENPSLIKRPVLQIDDSQIQISLGFSDSQYQNIFKEV